MTRITQVLFVLSLIVIKSLSDGIFLPPTACSTEASSATECFSKGCCWNGLNSCVECSLYCPAIQVSLLSSCDAFGCCPTVLNGVPQAQCQTPIAVNQPGPQCCAAVDGSCTAASINSGLCCDCSIDGVNTCGMRTYIIYINIISLFIYCG